MRRFSRKRRGGNRESGERSLDAELWLGRLRESDAIPDLGFTAWDQSEVPDHYAIVARGAGDEGQGHVVCFSPVEGGDALMAALATGAKLAKEESFTGEVVAIAPHWSIRSRRRLGLVRAELPYILRTLEVPALADAKAGIEPEADLDPAALPISTLASSLVNPRARSLFVRTVQGLEGLAAKHGGALRAFGRQVELIVATRRVAELRLDGEQPVLTSWGQQKSTAKIEAQNLVGALDELEGQVRRRLNDRKVREGEEGFRARALPLVVDAAQLREANFWPLGGSDEETIDLVGLREDGSPVAAGVRDEVDLRALGGFLDGIQNLRLAQTTLFAQADPPVLLQKPQLILAGKSFSAAALQAMAGLATQCEMMSAAEDKEKGLHLSPIGMEEASRSLVEAKAGRGRSRRSGGGRPSETKTEGGEASAEAVSGVAEEESADQRSNDRNRGRRRSRRRGRGKSGEGAPEAEAATESTEATRPSFDEISLFELGEMDATEEPKRERRRSRSGRGGKGRDKNSSTPSQASSSEGGSSADPGQPRSGPGEDPADIVEDGFDELADLPPSLDQGGTAVAIPYEDDEESEAATGGDDTVSTTAPVPVKPVAQQEEPAPKPRRRAVIVAAADRDSVSAAVLLARDVRLLEGIWIYPQADLMHFFREVTTDLKEDVPIHIVGFTPSPAGEVLQAVSLYAGQISWYDHHEWPPEDVFALEGSIGSESLHYTRGTGSTVPAVLATGTRRSRFSDKLVDLITARFTQHDYERWGRLWWWRLGQLATRSGDVRREIEGLLAGRPSDLAREASRADTPPIPAEVEWASGRDFRLVHFAGYVMVVVVAEGDIDPHLAGRIARERYGAQLSLTRREGEGLFLLTGDDQSNRRSLDYSGLAQHLADKLSWVQALESQDHVARFLIEGVEDEPDRLQEVISEIAMGRSVLER